MPVTSRIAAAAARGFGLFSAIAKVTDAYFKYVTLLLPGNGTNGAQNNTFLDSSTNNFTITRNGNTTQGTFAPYGANWSNYFNGTNAYLTTPVFGAGNGAGLFTSGATFTVETWLYQSSFVTTAGYVNTIIGDLTPTAATALWWAIGTDSSNAPVLRWYDGTTKTCTGSAALSTNTWNHVAFVCNAGTFTIYVNGTSQTLAGTTTITTPTGTTGNLYIGADRGNYVTGYASNLRVVKNSAVYTSNFTPSTTPLTAITNTQLLTCQSNRFIDNSSNAFAITISGSPSVQVFSPFSPTAAYSASTIGGSGYFDGSGDYLNGPSTGQFAPTGDFTISMWFYPTSFAASFYVLAGSWNSGVSDEWLIQYDNTGAIRFLTTTDSTFSASGVVKLNQWQFLSISRSGSTVTGYINGTSFRSYTLTGTVGSATKTVYVGIQAGTTWPYIGYMSDYRLVAGSAQSATPPTSPATAISGTNTLLSFTNAGVIDNAMMNDLETVGNAQISTTQSKWGGSSLSFNGTNSYLVNNSASTDLSAFGTGDFTVEFWGYFNNVTSDQVILDFRTSGSAVVACPLVVLTSTSTIIWSHSNVTRITSGTVSTGQWYHFAISRSGTSTKMFLNGTQAGSTYTDSTNYISAAGAPRVGYDYRAGSYYFNGYIDDLRITKGYARYTANFTAPTAAFPLQ